MNRRSPERTAPRYSRRDALHLLASACLCMALPTAGAAQVSRRTQPIKAFSTVELDGVGELHVVQGETIALVIEAEPRLLSVLSASVDNGVLSFDYGPQPIITTEPIRFLLTVRELTHLHLGGSGDCHIERLRTPSLNAEISGSGDLTINGLDTREWVAELAGSGSMTIGGKTVRQQVSISGAGDYQAVRLQSQHADVSIEGAGTIELSVAQRLVASIGGSGEIRYHGKPALVSRVSGAGSIEAEQDWAAARFDPVIETDW